jgi:predicted phosphodiesterase
MVHRLTRRQFLKLSGQALAATGTACLWGGLSPAQAAITPIEFDGRELVGRVGPTFATVQLVPRFTGSSQPATIKAKVQYDTDPDFANYRETPEVQATPYPYEKGGKHTGGGGGSELMVSKKYKLLYWDIAPGEQIENKTDGSVMTVTEVVDQHTVAGTLAGGNRNRWSGGDKWRLQRNYYRLEMKLTGLQPGTRYYYRVVLRYGSEAWQPPRLAHAFWTRRPTGEPFRFAIIADSHRHGRWEQWDALVGSLQAEQQVDFIVDLGDFYPMTRGNGKLHVRQFPEIYSFAMRTPRNGPGQVRGLSDLCTDAAYYFVRGNHEGLSDYDRKGPKETLADLLRMFVPNPNGSTYPEGGSHDSDYDQGYFAFTWGDALIVALDCVKYKDPKSVKDPARFHIGQEQLAWLTGVLRNSTARWKLVFTHNLFGGGDSYGRGGAAFAYEHGQAQVQALCEQHGAHIFHGHDHLLAKEWAGSVLYYCAGCAWGSQQHYDPNRSDWPVLYPEGFTPTSCRSTPPTCEQNGYVVVEVDPAQVRIIYKGFRGDVVDEMTLPG